jgi:ribosomal protein S17
MKKIILSKHHQEKKIIIATIIIYKTIKLLIDDNNIIYHYTDRVAIGKYNPLNKEIDFYFETQEQYDFAIKYNNITVKRYLED